ncbi:BatA and WFA domain-containing protein [soil metagenome]
MRTLFPIAVVLLCLLALPGIVVFGADLCGYEADINGTLEQRLGISHHLAVSLPAAIILFCIPPLIILLYFLRLKRKPVTVSSTYLWKKSIEDLHVNRLMQWMRKNVLLLLQLLAILTLIYAALGPRMHGRISGGKHYILIIDNSASMSATDVKPTRLAWAQAEALREIDGATDSDTGMVIVFNSTAEILQSYTNNRDELRAAVRSITPTQTPTRIDEALALAASLANPQNSTVNEALKPLDVEPGKERTYAAAEGFAAEVHLISDGRFPAPDFALANLSLNLHVPPVPNTDNVHADNLGIIKLDVERGWQKHTSDDAPDATDNVPVIRDADAEDVNKLTVYATVKNYREESAGPLKVRLDVLEGGDKLVRSYARTVKLAGMTPENAIGRTVAFHLTDVPEGADRVLRVSLEGAKDAFVFDDTAWVCFGVVRKAKVLIVSPDNNFLLRFFFESKSQMALSEVTWLTPEALTSANDYLSPAREGKFDLVIFDRCAPAREDAMPAANTFFLGTPPPPYKVAGTADPKAVTSLRGPTVQGWDDRHPLMATLRGLYDIGIDESFKFPDLPEGAKKLMEADRGHVLLMAIPRNAFTDVVLTFPLLTLDGKWNTRWPLENSFVLFLRNVLLTLGNVKDASADEPTVPGREKLLRPGAAKTIKITKPDDSSKTFDRGNRPDLAYSDTNLLGVYTAAWGDQTRRFAVNLFPTADQDEGDIAPAKDVTIGSQTITAGETRKQPRELWKWLVLAGLCVLMAEWWLYNQRVQI